MGTYALGVTFSLFVFIVIFLRLRNSGMKERYATWWIIISFIVLIFSLFPNLLSWFSEILGVDVPLNLGFFFSGIVLLLITLQYSVDLSRADEKARRLTEEIALVRVELDDLETDVNRLCRDNHHDEQTESGPDS